MSYAHASGHVSTEAPLCELVFVARAPGTVAGAVRPGDRLTPELYTARTPVQPLRWHTVETEVATTADGLRLYASRPNPFHETTRIAFELPTAQRATLRVFDAAGRTLWTQTRQHTAGYHEVALTLPSAKGLLFYQLTTDSGSVTRRMVAE